VTGHLTAAQARPRHGTASLSSVISDADSDRRRLGSTPTRIARARSHRPPTPPDRGAAPRAGRPTHRAVTGQGPPGRSTGAAAESEI
jgi:hypothetical protein